MHTKFKCENLQGKDHSEYLAADGRIIGWKSADWIHLAQDRDQ